MESERCTSGNKIFLGSSKRRKYFLKVAGCEAMIVGFWMSHYYFSHGNVVTIEKILLYPDETRTLLSYNVIRRNDIHVLIHMR